MTSDPSDFRTRVASAFDADGVLARAQPGFAERSGQRAMALAVADAIASGEALVAEAGTGTGKTFAYLVPALLSGARVLVSTGTRTLQDQLFRRDLPAVRQAFGLGARLALLKGRANYVCRHHLRRNLEEGRFERRDDIAQLRRIERFAALSRTGDRSEAPGIAEDAPIWAKATSTRENCLGQDCPDLADCFVFRARQAAQQADIVVVNHHLFCADLALRDEGISELLPTAGAVIFDEAHQLPEIAVQFFGRSLSTRQLGDFARDLLRIGLADARDAADWSAVSAGIEQAVRVWRLAAGRPGRRDAGQLRADREHREALAGLLGTLDATVPLLEAAAQRSRDLIRLALRGEELRRRLASWLALLDAAAADRSPPASTDRSPAAATDRSPAASRGAGSAFDDGDDRERSTASGDDAPPDPMLDEAVLWSEVHQGGVTLHATPLSVAPALKRHRQQHLRAWVFVSATLSVAGDFRHFTESVGMSDARTLQVDSPFDFRSNARLLVPQGCGDPGSDAYAERIAGVCWPLLEANHGRAFVLCTSLRMVERLAGLLRERADRQAEPLELLVQGSAPRAALLERFRSAERPVLVGSASFWEGVDVVGQQLSLVVIDKLPFAPPDDPVLRARTEALRRRGGDPFREIQLPAAAMALKQGAGRLIRSEADRGLLVVCDERLLTRSYGRRLVSSLPPFGIIRDLDEAIDWLVGEPALLSAWDDEAGSPA
ncbi:MAG: ATP-dependent DNA helicase [Limnobacter sp.]|nr:ATP-dependent DNA helicase [Limnobacter sp.]